MEGPLRRLASLLDVLEAGVALAGPHGPCAARSVVVASVLLALLGLGPAAGLEGQDFVVRPGEVLERVNCESDPTQSYALYVPSAYDAERRWPVLILMDPRGRAAVPMARFRAAAERLGYILASSYDTRSDGPAEPNVVALRAMMADLPERLSIDPGRLYLAGFSGTARIGWVFGAQLRGIMAGLIGFGGGLTQGFDLTQPLDFVFFGGSGRLDFNYREMRELDSRLDRAGLPHRFVHYPGPHGWAPREVCAEALEWMELQAIRSGLRPKDGAMVEDLLEAALERARAAEGAEGPGETSTTVTRGTTGDPLVALRRYRALVVDFEGLVPGAALAEARQAAERLSADPLVQELTGLERRLADEETEFLTRFRAWLGAFQGSDPPMPLDRSLERLGIHELRRRAAPLEELPGAAGSHEGSGTGSEARDPGGDERLAELMEARSARRRLEIVLVHTSFYGPRAAADRGNHDQAAAFLEIAEAVRALLERLRSQGLRSSLPITLTAPGQPLSGRP